MNSGFFVRAVERYFIDLKANKPCNKLEPFCINYI